MNLAYLLELLVRQVHEVLAGVRHEEVAGLEHGVRKNEDTADTRHEEEPAGGLVGHCRKGGSRVEARAGYQLEDGEDEAAELDRLLANEAEQQEQPGSARNHLSRARHHRLSRFRHAYKLQVQAAAG